MHKSTSIFKINIFKLITKYSKLMKSSVTLTFLKNYFKDIFRRKFKRVWVSKSHLFKKTFLKLSLQKCLDKLYSKCCEIFKEYLTSRRVIFVLTQPQNYYLWFFWVLLFFKRKFLTRIFITQIVCWFTEKINKTCLYVIEISELRQIRMNMVFQSN